MNQDVSYVVVVRCADQPVPAVPAVTVQCGTCSADCWLSAATGAGTLALACQRGTGGILCTHCMRQHPGKPAGVRNPPAEREAARQAARDVTGLLGW